MKSVKVENLWEWADTRDAAGLPSNQPLTLVPCVVGVGTLYAAFAVAPS